jgi:hypothetical protein
MEWKFILCLYSLFLFHTLISEYIQIGIADFAIIRGAEFLNLQLL